MGIYTVQSVARDRLQMFDDLVALVYEQSLSSKPLAMRQLLSMKIWAKIYDGAEKSSQCYLCRENTWKSITLHVSF